jgi:DNA-binding transcriptional LysR family regulator
MELTSLDLNLVVALRALLTERNVTHAGYRIGLSQPAMSSALARLRRHFSDDLLTRVGNHYELTALGTTLLGTTSAACDMLERVFTSQPDFEPAREEREFTLLTSDYALVTFGGPLTRTIAELAPGIRLRFQQIGSGIVESIEGVLSRVDGLIIPHGLFSGYPTVELYEDNWVCVTDAEDASELSLTSLTQRPWVIYQRAYDVVIGKQLGVLGVDLQVAVSVDSFTVIPALIVGTDRIAMLQERLARQLQRQYPIRIAQPPFKAMPLKEAMWYHPAHTQDAGHLWLRETVATVAKSLQK